MSNANSNRTIFNTVEARIGQRFHSNPILVGASVFVLLFGSFLASAFLFGAVLFDISSIFQPGVESFLIWPPAWTAFTISILITVILVNQNLGIRRYDETTQKLTQILEPYAGYSDQLKCMSSQQLRYLDIVTIAALAIGGLVVIIYVLLPASGIRDVLLTPRMWFTLVVPILVVLFARSIALAIIVQQNIRQIFAQVRLKNVFRHKPLKIFVQLALKRLLGWMTLIAFSVLFFVKGENVQSVGIPWLLTTTCCAIWSFRSTVDIGRSLMERHKEEELAKVQHNIAALETRFSNGNDPEVATKLMVHLAMERRVMNLSEASIEFPAGVKALVYILLPVMTLTAASIARTVVDIAAHRIME